MNAIGQSIAKVVKVPNSIMPAMPRHTVLDLRQFVDSANDFFILGTGWQAQKYREWLTSNGKDVVAFVKNPLLPPLQSAPLRHRFGGRVIDFANLLIDQCASVVEDYTGDSFYGLPVLDPASVDWKRAKTYHLSPETPDRSGVLATGTRGSPICRFCGVSRHDFVARYGLGISGRNTIL